MALDICCRINIQHFSPHCIIIHTIHNPLEFYLLCNNWYTMVTKLCCFCCRPQSTRHLAHLFTVRTIAINSIENVESKCACTLVTGTHKCFNIFTPTSHCVAYIPSNIPTNTSAAIYTVAFISTWCELQETDWSYFPQLKFSHLFPARTPCCSC